MIRSYEQAVAVQQRRVDAGKYGWAKAVRRYLKRQAEEAFFNAAEYKEAKEALPHLPIEDKIKEREDAIERNKVSRQKKSKSKGKPKKGKRATLRSIK